jgi:hypothetical protein
VSVEDGQCFVADLATGMNQSGTSLMLLCVKRRIVAQDAASAEFREVDATLRESILVDAIADLGW